MLTREYDNLDDLLVSFCRELMLNNNLFDWVQGSQGYLSDTLLVSHSPDCSIDLADYGYTSSKWAHLLGTYLDLEEWDEFCEKIQDASAMSLTYYFNQKEINNGSCLIALVLTREIRRGKWTEAKLLYRTTELQRRFAADLVFLNRLINDLPEICEIDRISIYLPQCYLHGLFIHGHLDVFGVNPDDVETEHQWGKSFHSNKERYFSNPDEEYNSYASLARMQKAHFEGIDQEPILVETLHLRRPYVRRTKK